MSTTIDNGDAGYTEVDGDPIWATFVDAGAYGGDIRYANNGTGSKARFTFSGLTAGHGYRVGLTWTSGGGAAVPWRIYDSDNTTVLASGTVNQGSGPSGFSFDGATWTELSASEVITGTSLRVEIDNTGGTAIADGAYIDDLGAAGPAAPTSLTCGTPTPTSVPLTWEDNASDETGFEIEYSTESDFTGAVSVTINTADTQTSTVLLLAPGTLYYFRVRAYNGDGNSDWSNTASATTPSSDGATGGRSTTLRSRFRRRI